MRILLVHHTNIGTLGGTDVSWRRLAEGYTKLQHPVGIIEMSSQWGRSSVPELGLPVWSLTIPAHPRLRRPRSWASVLRSAWQFERVTFEFKPDIVQVIFAAGQAVPIWAASHIPHRWRLVISLRGSDVQVLPYEDPVQKTWTRRLLLKADAVTAVSRAVLESAEQLIPGISERSRVIYNGLGPHWIQVQPEQLPIPEKRVLFVGRLHPVKGIDSLLLAWEKVCATLPDAQLWIVGEGPERQSLEMLAGRLKINSSVRFLGSVPRHELPELYRQAHTVVLPSRSEGLSWTLLEGGACGALCVATNVGGIPEVIEDKKTGFLVEPDSPASLATTLIRGLCLPAEERLLLTQAARQRIRDQFSLEKMISRHLTLFDSLLGGSRTNSE